MVVRKMKEKCKDAARMRRDKERAEFIELSKLLPLPSSTTSQLDKASIIRLTSSYLRMRSAFPQGLGSNWGLNGIHINSQTTIKSTIRSEVNFQQEYKQSTFKQDRFIGSVEQQQHQQVRELGSLILQTLDGFVFALHRDGKIMYISETASVHLGLPQIDLTGSSVFEYVHPSDHNDIYEIFNLDEMDRSQLESAEESSMASTSISSLDNEQRADYELPRSFCIRMKCILPKRNAGLVSSGYKAIHCNGYLKARRFLGSKGGMVNKANVKEARLLGNSSNGVKLSSFPIANKNNTSCIGSKQGEALRQDHPLDDESSSSNQSSNTINNMMITTSTQQTDLEWESYALVAVGHSLLPTASTEFKLTGDSFMFRANLDLKLYYIEAPVNKLLDFEQYEMISQSLYQFVHLNDINGLKQSHKSLLNKGQVVTKYYRIMKKNGGFIWVQSYASLVNNPRNMPKPQHIVSICFVLGENHLDKSSICSPLLATPMNCQLNEQSTAINMNSNKNHKMTNDSVLEYTNPNKTSKKPLLSLSTDNRKTVNTNNNNKKRSQLSHNGTKKARKVTTYIDTRTNALQTKETRQINNIEDNCTQPILIESYHDNSPFQQAALQNETASDLFICQQHDNYNQCSESSPGTTINCFDSSTFMQGQPLQLSPQSVGSSIRSSRQSIDDSCSIVSSVASTSACSSVSSSISSSAQYHHSLNNQPPLAMIAPHNSLLSCDIDPLAAPPYPAQDQPLYQTYSNHYMQDNSCRSCDTHTSHSDLIVNNNNPAYEQQDQANLTSASNEEHQHWFNSGFTNQHSNDESFNHPCSVQLMSNMNTNCSFSSTSSTSSTSSCFSSSSLSGLYYANFSGNIQSQHTDYHHNPQSNNMYTMAIQE